MLILSKLSAAESGCTQKFTILLQAAQKISEARRAFATIDERRSMIAIFHPPSSILIT